LAANSGVGYWALHIGTLARELRAANCGHYEHGKSTLIGEQPHAVAAELPKLWKIEWRQQQ
jgi:hypothetical protein